MNITMMTRGRDSEAFSPGSVHLNLKLCLAFDPSWHYDNWLVCYWFGFGGGDPNAGTLKEVGEDSLREGRECLYR